VIVSKKVDLTGKVFGHLTVVGEGQPYVSPKGQRHNRWHCECDCGKEVNVAAGDLTSGKTRSCGHAFRTPDLIGKHFGHLDVVGKSDKLGQNNAVIWECKCDCGNITYATTAQLTSGHKRSCGHPSRKALKESVEKRVKETPGTNLNLLNNKPPMTNTSGEKNITIVYRNGRKRFRVAVVYQKRQYGGLRDTMEEAIELREQLRREHWPNYQRKN